MVHTFHPPLVRSKLISCSRQATPDSPQLLPSSSRPRHLESPSAGSWAKLSTEPGAASGHLWAQTDSRGEVSGCLSSLKLLVRCPHTTRKTPRNHETLFFLVILIVLQCFVGHIRGHCIFVCCVELANMTPLAQLHSRRAQLESTLYCEPFSIIFIYILYIHGKLFWAPCIIVFAIVMLSHGLLCTNKDKYCKTARQKSRCLCGRQTRDETDMKGYPCPGLLVIGVVLV